MPHYSEERDRPVEGVQFAQALCGSTSSRGGFLVRYIVIHNRGDVIIAAGIRPRAFENLIEFREHERPASVRTLVAKAKAERPSLVRVRNLREPQVLSRVIHAEILAGKFAGPNAWIEKTRESLQHVGE
jgi:hypothetical protein